MMNETIWKSSAYPSYNVDENVVDDAARQTSILRGFCGVIWIPIYLSSLIWSLWPRPVRARVRHSHKSSQSIRERWILRWATAGLAVAGCNCWMDTAAGWWWWRAGGGRRRGGGSACCSVQSLLWNRVWWLLCLFLFFPRVPPPPPFLSFLWLRFPQSTYSTVF